MNRLSRIQPILPIILVLILTLLVLTYVGYGEAKRTYPGFQVKKMATQVEIIDNAVSSHLMAGLPLKLFSGFSSLAGGLLNSDQDIAHLRILDSRQRTIFAKSRDRAPDETAGDAVPAPTYRAMHFPFLGSRVSALESAQGYQVRLMLESKFGVAGQVVIEADKAQVFGPLNLEYRTVFSCFGLLSLLITLFILAYELLFDDKPRRRLVLTTVYGLSFLVMVAIIGSVIFRVYEHGAKANTKAMADSMGQRLGAILDLGLELKDIDGINTAFLDYKKSNPDINAIALTKGGIASFHTEAARINQLYRCPADCYEYAIDLGQGQADQQALRMAVTIPVEVVMAAIRASAKNFIVLFVACTLVALIFLDAGIGMLGRAEARSSVQALAEEGPGPQEEEYSSVALKLVKPAYFLIIFVHAMSVSFLPQLVSRLAVESGSSLASASLPFTVYYAVFALVLIPAGLYAEKGSLRRLMAAGFMAEALGLVLVGMTSDYWLLTLGRGCSGLGQGIFLIGLQSYLLAVVPKTKRTQGAAVKVIGRNAGLIAGTSIGALLYAFMDYQRIFMLASILCLVGFLYLLALVSNPPASQPHKHSAGRERRNRRKRFFRNIVEVIKDREVCKVLLFVGLVAKMGITGVVMFAVPLVLARQNMATEDIGQVLMLYYIASMITTHHTSKLVDRLNATRAVLLVSALVGGAGLVVLGFLGNTGASAVSVLPGVEALNALAIQFNRQLAGLGLANGLSVMAVACLILSGISNGLMAAPVFTHIGKSAIAQRFDNKSVAATYVFLERIGHVCGPMVVSTLFMLTGQSNIAISYFGAITIVLGVLFGLTARRSP